MDSSMNKGYVMLARQIVDSEIFEKPATWLKIFIYLLIQAQHEPYKKLKRGQCYTTYAAISRDCGVKRGEIYRALRHAKSVNMIVTERGTRGIVVTICNYNTYQDNDHYKSDSKRDGKRDKTVTAACQGRDTINKECNNETPYGDLKEIQPPKEWMEQHAH